MERLPYRFMDKAESLEHLRGYHEEWTKPCCPRLPGENVLTKLPELESLVGSHPVYSNSLSIVRDNMYMLFGSMDWLTSTRLRNFFTERLTQEEFLSNQLTPENFKYLKDEIQAYNGDRRMSYMREFEWIRRSSPKLSNFLASVLKWAGYDEPDSSDAMIAFNNRGNETQADLEMLVSTEPHRIAGMSAFGVFGSCQDWIDKESEDHEYHDLAHQAWSNLVDPTCGVIFIRRKVENDDNHNETEDMLARSLIRVYPLPNGHVMVYLSRIYAESPYDSMMEASLQVFASTLPENYHVIHMYTHPDRSSVRGHTRSGAERVGVNWTESGVHFRKTIRQRSKMQCEECHGEGHALVPCNVDECEGGYVTLKDSSGNGYFTTCKGCSGRGSRVDWDEYCEACDGTGYQYGDGGKVKPYNDHSDWISFGSTDEGFTTVSFNVPLWVSQYEDVVEVVEVDEAEEIA